MITKTGGRYNEDSKGNFNH